VTVRRAILHTVLTAVVTGVVFFGLRVLFGESGPFGGMYETILMVLFFTALRAGRLIHVIVMDRSQRSTRSAKALTSPLLRLT
jgi:hypothetical protein